LLALIAGEVALIVGIAALVGRTTKSAAWRRTIWQACLLGIAALLLLELSGVGRFCAGFTSRRTVPDQAVFTHGRETPERAAQSAPEHGSRRREEAEGPTSQLQSQMPNRDRLITSAATMPAAPSSGDLSPQSRARESLTETSMVLVAGAVWLLGAGIVLTRICLARLLFVYLRRYRVPVSDADLLQRVKRLAQRAGVRRPVRLFESEGLIGPIALGVWRPIIGLPARFTQSFGATQQEAMLVHELAHLAARDPAWNFLATILSAALWWHPLVWWARRQFRVSSEIVADEATLAVNDGPESLAGCLMTIGERCLQRESVGWLGIEGAAYRSALGQRVARLISLDEGSWFPVNETAARWAKTLGSAGLSLASLLIAAWLLGPVVQGEQIWRSWRQSVAAVRGVVSALVAGGPQGQARPSGFAGGFSEASRTGESGVSPQLVLRRVRANAGIGAPHAVSSDGRYLSGVVGDSVAVTELASGSVRSLAVGAGPSLFSPDATSLATFSLKDRSLWLAPLDGSAPQLLFQDEEVSFVNPRAWSQDGNPLLATVVRRDRSLEVVSFAMPAGALTVLWSFPSGEAAPERMDLSPDGRFIVCEAPQPDDPKKSDLYVWSSDGAQPSALVQHPADDRLLGWVPRANHVLFRSDRRGTMDVWAIEVLEGKSAGAPVLIKANLGPVLPLGFSADGAFYFRNHLSKENVFIARFDGARSQVQGPPALLTHFAEGSTGQPDWSPRRTLPGLHYAGAEFGCARHAAHSRHEHGRRPRRAHRPWPGLWPALVAGRPVPCGHGHEGQAPRARSGRCSER
jgi:hypothetical protein